MKQENLVEYYGQQVTLADKEKMEPVIKVMKRKASKTDLQNFVAKFSEFLSEGTLIINRFRKWKCIICLKYGHPREICPMSWQDGKRIKLCYVCKKGDLPHPECKKDCCYYCSKKGHISRDCPEETKSLAELEKQEKNEGTKKTDEENEDEEENKPVEKENGTQAVSKKKGKKNKRPLEENTEESVSSPKKNKKKNK